MTCIVGYGDGQNVWMGADSASGGHDGWAISTVVQPKVFSMEIKGHDHRLLIGYTTSFRMGQILEHHVEIPGDRIPVRGLEQRYLIREFIPRVRSALRHYGFTKIEDNQEEAGVFLVGLFGRVFRVDVDYHVNQKIDGYDAIGCGAAFALGSLWENRGEIGPAHVYKALEAAEHFSGGVARPFGIYVIPSSGPMEKLAL